MGKSLHVYNKEAIKKEPFLPMDRPFARSLKIIRELKQATRKYMHKWELENHLIKRYAKYLDKKSPVDLEIRWVNATIGNGVFTNQLITDHNIFNRFDRAIGHAYVSSRDKTPRRSGSTHT